jgi:uncharacterized protein DUF4406
VRKQALTAALQAYAAIDLRDAVYVACPVSSGRRELDLMATLSLFDRDQLRYQHARRWQRDVLQPNKLAAAAAVEAARGRHRGRNVINPSEFELDGLTQPDYDMLCADIIRHHVRYFVLADGWQFSRGACLETVLALDLKLNIEDNSGALLNARQIMNLMAQASSDLIRAGFSDEVVAALLPRPTPVG